MGGQLRRRHVYYNIRHLLSLASGIELKMSAIITPDKTIYGALFARMWRFLFAAERGRERERGERERGRRSVGGVDSNYHVTQCEDSRRGGRSTTPSGGTEQHPRENQDGYYAERRDGETTSSTATKRLLEYGWPSSVCRVLVAQGDEIYTISLRY